MNHKILEMIIMIFFLAIVGYILISFIIWPLLEELNLLVEEL